MPTNTINARPFGYVNPACPVNWAHPLNNGLIGWWKGITNPGWVGGLKWFRDLVRGHTPHDAAIAGGVTWVQGQTAGLCPKFNGTTGNAQFWTCNFSTTGPFDFGTTSFSFGCRVKLGTNSNGIFMCKGQQQVAGWGFQQITTTIYLLVSDGTNSITPSITVVQGNWYYLTTVINRASGNALWYVNGKLQSTTSLGSVGSVSSASGDGNLAAAMTSPGHSISNEWAGIMDEGFVYNRALTTNEAIARYRLAQQRYPGVLNYITPVTYFGVTAAPAATDTYPAYRPNQTFCDRITEEIFVL